MNDFTKEELEIIRHALRIDIAKGGDYAGEKFEHKNAIRQDLAFYKIQFMIDNYDDEAEEQASYQRMIEQNRKEAEY